MSVQMGNGKKKNLLGLWAEWGDRMSVGGQFMK
jgi:hypothetical protein